MIIAIDESGSFAEGSPDHCFYVSVRLRQRKTLYKIKKQQFLMWENGLTKSLKDHKGEIKSSSLSDDDLLRFVKTVCLSEPGIGITPTAIVPQNNPSAVVEKHKEVQRKGIEVGLLYYVEKDRTEVANFYRDYHNWFKKLSYPLYLKIYLLGECIVHSLINAIGHSISGNYDDELPRLRFMIDRDFIRNNTHWLYWRDLLRNQLWHISEEHPIPYLDKWDKKGHPFLDKYTRNGRPDLGKLFSENCDFCPSHTNFEIRIADAVGTIIRRHFDNNSCREAYNYLKYCFCKDGKIVGIELSDFDLTTYKYHPELNPWLAEQILNVPG